MSLKEDDQNVYNREKRKRDGIGNRNASNWDTHTHAKEESEQWRNVIKGN